MVNAGETGADHFSFRTTSEMINFFGPNICRKFSSGCQILSSYGLALETSVCRNWNRFQHLDSAAEVVPWDEWLMIPPGMQHCLSEVSVNLSSSWLHASDSNLKLCCWDEPGLASHEIFQKSPIRKFFENQSIGKFFKNHLRRNLREIEEY